ncbi:hypothetical protein [uncultured Shewanella sp.]|uniref:hypothetical protein n=1 Tax=uncultured Shewanella sp. TaxID=173975 RepID=UPI002606A4F0|nr:hypothetical protein [uncultured Shewanella sp.]
MNVSVVKKIQALLANTCLVKRVKNLLKASVIALGLCCAFGVNAGHKVGVVTHVFTYTNSDRILVKLDNMPEKSICKGKDYFAIADNVPADRRHQVLSRLLTAFATGKKTVIYYSDKDCAHDKPKIIRVG